jgi:predicted dehydrogenase
MPLRIGILGLGFMGLVHFKNFMKAKGAKVTAICDVDPAKRKGNWSKIGGNIGSGSGRVDLSKFSVYADPAKLNADPNVDVVDITLPTFLHARTAIAALKAGKHVICEKPMALNSREAAKMIAVAKRARRQLHIAHCIRYWPSYAVARQIIRSGKYGRVISATFRRFASTPLWSHHNWLQRPDKSGACALDLHIHDADFVLHTFGKPKAVTCHGAGFRKGRVDHILASYQYGSSQLITAEGGWEYANGFPFDMSFAVAMEKGSLYCTMPDLNLMLYPLKGKAKKIPVPAGDGYQHELQDFVRCIATGKASKVVTPQDARRTVRLVELEVQSALKGKTVPVKL